MAPKSSSRALGIVLLLMVAVLADGAETPPEQAADRVEARALVDVFADALRSAARVPRWW